MKRFALLGNPNSGKTTLFNSLTGSTAHVGNWPGVTVDKKEGTYKKLDKPISIIDLPGIYSLSPYTPEEVVSRNYILDEKPDCVINIVDATNLERNLYLTTQALEIDVPLIVALNMSDVVRKQGDTLNAQELSKRLGVPVVEISALRNENLDKLMEEAVKCSNLERKGQTVIQDKNLLHLISDIQIAFEGKGVDNPLFHAIKLVELDEIETKMHPDLVGMVEKYKASFHDDVFDNDFEAIVADARYNYISKNYSPVYKRNDKKENNEEKLSHSDKIDKVLTHRFWAIPLFLIIMFLIFHITFSEDLFFMGAMGLNITLEGWINFFSGMNGQEILKEGGLRGIPSLGVFLQNWMGFATGSLTDLFASFMPGGWWLTSLVVDGILAGLDAVLSFIPQILLLFLFIAILEDSGYMARVAFILDRAFRKFGLSGKAFIPMLTGFGCSVPAIMATRTLEDEKEKNRTIRLMTCFSCGAKAPIWTLLAAIGTWSGIAGDVFVYSIYIGGVVMAIVYAIFMKLFSKDQYVSPFIMELPAYHLPQAKNVLAHLWEKFKHYIIKAATIILASTIVIWFLKSFGWENGKFTFLLFEELNSETSEMEWVLHIDGSILAYIGKGLSYFYYPLGWAMGNDGWKYTVSTFTGLIAKEDVVATMGVLGLNESTIGLNAAGAYSFAFYNLFTLPCFAAIGAAKGEQTRKEFWLTISWWFAMSYGAALVIYWVGTLYAIALWAGILMTAIIIAIIVLAAYFTNKKQKEHLQAH